MSEGCLLAARENGAYVLRLVGDVRMNLCTTLEDFVQGMLSDPAFATVWLDVCEAEGIDSTTLGQLAQLAIEVRERFGFRPAVYSCNPSISRLLRSMGFHQLFELHDVPCGFAGAVDSVPVVEGSTDSVRSRVLAAHQTLMSLNEENRARFSDLVDVLKQA